MSKTLTLSKQFELNDEINTCNQLTLAIQKWQTKLEQVVGIKQNTFNHSIQTTDILQRSTNVCRLLDRVHVTQHDTWEHVLIMTDANNVFDTMASELGRIELTEILESYKAFILNHCSEYLSKLRANGKSLISSTILSEIAVQDTFNNEFWNHCTSQQFKSKQSLNLIIRQITWLSHNRGSCLKPDINDWPRPFQIQQLCQESIQIIEKQASIIAAKNSKYHKFTQCKENLTILKHRLRFTSFNTMFADDLQHFKYSYNGQYYSNPHLEEYRNELTASLHTNTRRRFESFVKTRIKLLQNEDLINIDASDQVAQSSTTLNEANIDRNQFNSYFQRLVKHSVSKALNQAAYAIEQLFADMLEINQQFKKMSMNNVNIIIENADDISRIADYYYQQILVQRNSSGEEQVDHHGDEMLVLVDYFANLFHRAGEYDYAQGYELFLQQLANKLKSNFGFVSDWTGSWERQIQIEIDEMAIDPLEEKYMLLTDWINQAVVKWKNEDREFFAKAEVDFHMLSALYNKGQQMYKQLVAKSTISSSIDDKQSRDLLQEMIDIFVLKKYICLMLDKDMLKDCPLRVTTGEQNTICTLQSLFCQILLHARQLKTI